MNARKLIEVPEVRLSIIFILCIAIDQLSKSFFASSSPSDTVQSEWISFLVQTNGGVIGGFLSDLSPAIGRIFFSVLGIFLVIFSALVIYFLKHKETPRLKAAIVLFATGLISNVFDRAFRGEVIDFIAVRLSQTSFFVFNVADVFVAIGFILFAFAVFSEYSEIWFENNTRKSFLIDKPFQLQYTKLLIAFAVMQGAVIIIYSYAFLSVYIGREASSNTLSIIHNYLVGISILELCFIVLSVGLGILLSHRAAGPIYSFQAFFERWREGVTKGGSLASIRLRKTDHFKILEKISEDMTKLELKNKD